MPRGPVKKIKQKMSEQDEALIRRLTSANPCRKESLSDYAESDEARRAFARILACEAEPVRPAVRPRKVRTLRLAWVGATVALVVAAIVLSVVYLGARTAPTHMAVSSGSPSATAAAAGTSTSTGLAFRANGIANATTATTAADTPGTMATPPTTSSSTYQQLVPFTVVAGIPPGLPIPVPRSEALAGIVRLYREIATPDVLYPLPPEFGSTDALVREAQDIGVVRASEGPDYRLQMIVTRRDYAVWVWRAFGRLLTPTIAGISPSGLGSLSAEQQIAVAGLVRTGILESFRGPMFADDTKLEIGDEEMILHRLSSVLLPDR